MSWCAEAGIPHSELLEWDPTDRAKLTAYLLEKNLVCQMCGTADWQWDPKQGGKLRAFDPVDVVCRGCAVKEAASERDPEERTLHGHRIELRPTGTRESAARLRRAAKAYDGDVAARKPKSRKVNLGPSLAAPA